jgi:hypothetical protein
MIGNYIKAGGGGVSRSTAKLMKTGQTTAYRTGDDGNLQAGRDVSFTVLAENNPFGNTNRFTDELGGQTYTNNIVIDWSTYDGATVLGYRRTLGTQRWDWAIDNANSVNVGGFIGWRMTNIHELLNIMNYGLTSRLNYSPFNITSSVQLWMSNTANVTTQAWYYENVSGNILQANKTGTGALWFLICRTFTVTGTTLS